MKAYAGITYAFWLLLLPLLLHFVFAGALPSGSSLLSA
jgi:hypothetical protein